jgi:hypothetical protein
MPRTRAGRRRTRDDDAANALGAAADETSLARRSHPPAPPSTPESLYLGRVEMTWHIRMGCLNNYV